MKRGYKARWRYLTMSNETQPEIRFPGFTEDWKQRKLIEGVSKIGDGLHGTPSYSEDGDVFFINGNNLVNGKISITKETKFVNESDQSKDDKSLNVNTILMSINGTIGNLAWYNNEKVMLGKSIAYLTVSDFDKNFVYFYLQTPMMRKYFISNLTGTTIKNLGLKTIRNTELFVADLDEQQKIGNFFKKLDTTIALHQRKLDLLKETKKGFLQKMFPKNGAKVPEIRFPGFTGDWEQRKLGEYLVPYNEVTTENNQYPVLTSSRKGLFFQKDYYDGNQIASEDNTGYNIVPRGYFTYRHMSDDLIFKFNINDIADKGIVSTLYPVFTTTSDLDSKYLQYQLNGGQEFKRFAILQKQGGSRTYMYLSKLKNMFISIPKYNEQIKISTFFKQLDDTIALHQRKLDLLKETKKGFLQMMFV